MLLAFERFLLLNFPYVICTTLAALVIWGEDVGRYLPRFLLYAFLAALAQTLTNQINTRDNLEVVRFIVEVTVCYGIAWLVFRKPWFWVFKIYATSYLIGYLTVAVGIAVCVGLLIKHLP